MLPGLPASAADRLLPPHLPGRFFAAAVLFHLAAWLLLLGAGPDALLGFTGGPGPVAAALHLLTLGTLGMSALGAALQMLPVVTNRALAHPTAARWLFVLYAPGVALLGLGLTRPLPGVRMMGGAMTGLGLALFAAMVIHHLLQVSGMQALRRHLALALAALVGLVLLGLGLLADFSAGWFDNHRAVAAAHAVLAGYGFMGMLAFGFSTVLIPMFVLGPAIPETAARRSVWLAAPALGCGVIGLLGGSGALTAIGALFGLAAVVVHLLALAGSVRRRMRRRLEPFFRLVWLSWAMLLLSLVLGLALALGAPADPWAVLWGLALVPGWLLSFVLAILQRILPFLAAMHSATDGRPPVLPSRLETPWATTLHSIAHASALALITAGLLAGLVWPLWLGLAAGAIGAVAFTLYAAGVPWRLSRFRAALAASAQG